MKVCNTLLQRYRETNTDTESVTVLGPGWGGGTGPLVLL